MRTKYVVEIYEYERGWGSRLDGTYFFDTLEEAQGFAARENAKNTLPSAPDIYWSASEPFLVDMDTRKKL